MTGATESSGAAVTGSQSNTTSFGTGLKVTAYTATSSSRFARFSITREDASSNQVVTYTTSSQNAMAEAGADHSVAAGQFVFGVGETNKEVWVPFFADALRDRRTSSISLEVQEHHFNDQKEVHVLIQPLEDSSSKRHTVLSGVRLEVNESSDTAKILLRGDTNSQDQINLNLLISTRITADTLAVSKSQEISIRDFIGDSDFNLPVDSLQNLSLDLDARTNRQVSANLQVNLLPKANQSLVSLLGPDPLWQTTVQLLNGNQVRFSQDAPLTSWRTDSGAGLVTFGLQAGASSLTLISNAQGGSAGSLNSTNANAATSWQTTEGRAIGTRSITNVQNLSDSTWTPTATSQDGVPLQLLNLAVDGNQVTATFSGGVTGVFWQADGNAPSLLPVPAAVEVQRLAGFNNSLGFYTVDSITGMVAGLNPGDVGYLQAALQRSVEEDLLIDASSLPAFGATSTFNSLPLDTRERYGLLLLQNGDRSVIFSSFAAANESGATQMVSLSNSSNSLVLGIEDISVAKGLSDNDFNDIIVKIRESH